MGTGLARIQSIANGLSVCNWCVRHDLERSVSSTLFGAPYPPRAQLRASTRRRLDQAALLGHPPRAQLRASTRRRRPSWPDRATPLAGRNCALQTDGGDKRPTGPPPSRATARFKPTAATKWPDRATPLARNCALQPEGGDQVARPGHPPRAQLRASNRRRRPSGPTGPPPSRATARFNTEGGDQVARPGHPPRAQLRVTRRRRQCPPAPLARNARFNPTAATKWPDRATPLARNSRASRRRRPVARRAAAQLRLQRRRRPSGPTGPRAQLRASNRRRRPSGPTWATPLARNCALQTDGGDQVARPGHPPRAHCALQTDGGDQVARPGHPPRAQLRAQPDGGAGRSAPRRRLPPGRSSRSLGSARAPSPESDLRGSCTFSSGGGGASRAPGAGGRSGSIPRLHRRRAHRQEPTCRSNPVLPISSDHRP